MKRLLFTLAAAALLAPTALAKGPSQATVTGPGLAEAIVLAGLGDSSALTEQAGFFPAVFGQTPSPMIKRPAGKLGPRYTIHYVVPGGNTKPYRITQYLYPYATGGAVTYMLRIGPPSALCTNASRFPSGDQAASTPFPTEWRCFPSLRITNTFPREPYAIRRPRGDQTTCERAPVLERLRSGPPAAAAVTIAPRAPLAEANTRCFPSGDQDGSA